MSDSKRPLALRRPALFVEPTSCFACPAPAGSGTSTRRAVLVSLGGTLLTVACGRREPIAPAVAAAVPITAEATGFHHLSQALTGHADLDATTAARLAQAFARTAPDLHAHFAALGELVQVGMSAPEVLAAATAAGLKPVALAIVAAWYTGTVGKGTSAVTVSYRDALMQRPVADALTPPTYIGGGPAWWTAPPPEVGLPARAVRPAAASTVGSTR